MIGGDVDAGADRQLDLFVERRALAVHEDRAGQQAANELELMWAESERRHREKTRRANRALWYSYFANVAASLRGLADEYDARAEALLQPTEGEGGVCS